eukprot:497057-Amorphochlora_amoeboformis.AAC.1
MAAELKEHEPMVAKVGRVIRRQKREVAESAFQFLYIEILQVRYSSRGFGGNRRKPFLDAMKARKSRL